MSITNRLPQNFLTEKGRFGFASEPITRRPSRKHPILFAFVQAFKPLGPSI
jgi:hypothetical protein